MEEPADEPKTPPLPAIELPPQPPDPEGVPQAREASKRIRSGGYPGALPLYREAWDKGVKSENSTYNAACAAAVTGHTDEALVWLDRTAEAGYRDTAHLEVDNDLDSLRDDPRFTAFVKKAEANAELHDSENNAELRELVEADQTARHLDMSALSEEERRAAWEKISADDAARRALVAEIMAAGGAHTGGDYYAAAWDRWLVKAGYPQRFGTQCACNPDCKLQQWDESTTDEMRARWNVPPLETAKKMMDRR
jgi:hypothetical protein